MSDEKQLLTFPCQFPIKIMGHNQVDLIEDVIEIMQREFAHINHEHLTINYSSNNKYISITVTVEAQSKEQLDVIYQALTSHEKIVMAL